MSTYVCVCVHLEITFFNKVLQDKSGTFLLMSSTIITSCGTKRACDFMYRQKRFDWMKGTEENRIFHRIWSRLNEPFLIPAAVCTHDLGGISQYVCGSPPGSFWNHSTVEKILHVLRDRGVDGGPTWQKYDFNQAGCLLCGSMHICFDGICPVQKSSEGYDICTITAMCVKGLSFSSDEYMDTVAMFHGMGESGLSSGHGIDCHVPEISSELSTSDLKRRKKSSKLVNNVVVLPLNQNVCAPGGEVNAQVQRKSADTARDAMGASTGCSGVDENHSTYHSMRTADVQKPSNNRCIVNKKNRYRSWVYHRVMHHHHDHHTHNSRHLNERGVETGIIIQVPVATSSGYHHLGGGWQPRHANMDNDVTRSLIQGVVSDVLCSSKWRKSMEMEVLIACSLTMPSHALRAELEFVAYTTGQEE